MSFPELDILKYVDDRNDLMLTGSHDELVELLFADEPDDCVFISAIGFFDKSRNRKLVPACYKPRCVFELGKIMNGTGVGLALFWLTKSDVRECRFSTLKIARPLEGDPKAKDGSICAIQKERFSEEYLDYLKACEVYAAGDKPAKASKLGAFFSVPIGELAEDRFTPSYYAPELRRIRKEVERAESVPLGDAATILKPRKAKDGARNVLVLHPKNVRFPVDLEALDRGDATTVVLQRGDVVICTVGDDNRAIVFDRDGDEPVYAAPACAVVRARSMSPEYLCFYLSSTVAKAILSSLSKGIVLKQLLMKALSEFPVVKPRMNDAYYLAEYAVLSGHAPRDYTDLRALRSADPAPVESILDKEIASRINAYCEEQLRDFLSSDIDELNTCFAHGAYKAAIILAGSILEAVLIDWLSEIKHVNYFEEDYYVYDRRTGRSKRADLYDYINEIEFIEQPDWADEARLAHAIRKKRNLVHAKVCIPEGNANEKTARMVIEYLDRVLRTRGVHCIRKS